MGQSGMAHLCEHIRAGACNERLGTEKLRRITLEAFTEREETFFLLRAPKEDAVILVEWLAHFLEPAHISAEEFEHERAVVLEETITLECSEIEKIDNAFMSSAYHGSDYGRPVAGISQELSAIGREAYREFISTRPHCAGMVVALVGDIDATSLWDDVTCLLEAACCNSNGDGDPCQSAHTLGLIPGNVAVHTALDMTYFLLGFSAMERTSANRANLYAISAYLGDDIDSLLYRELRQKRALIYNVRTDYHLYRQTGHLVIKGIASNDNFQTVTECLRDILEHMRYWLPDEKVAEQLRHSLKKSLLINLDDPRNKLLRLLKHELWFSTFYSIEDDLRFINNVSERGLSDTAAQIFSQPPLLCYGA